MRAAGVAPPRAMALRLARRCAPLAAALPRRSPSAAVRRAPRGAPALRCVRALSGDGDAATRRTRTAAAAADGVASAVEATPAVVVDVPPLFAPGAPRVLVFVSRDSGPQSGGALSARLRAAVGAAQVWDLPDDPRGGPDAAAALLAADAAAALASGLPAARVAVCGGDGTASWVFAALHAAWPAGAPPSACAVLPLGTGNDLSRVTGWAHCSATAAALAPSADAAQLRALLDAVAAAPAAPLDWWEVAHTRGDAGSAVDAAATSASPAPPAAVRFTNYCSVGFDAGVALAFDAARRALPAAFANRTTNKAVYGVLGARDAALGACAMLAEHVTLHADGRVVPIPRGAKGIVLLNISSFMGGARPWPQQQPAAAGDAGSSASGGVPAPHDGLLEVAAHYGALHLAAMNLGLAAAVPLAVAREVRIAAAPAGGVVPFQADGEAWAMRAPAELRVARAGELTILHAPLRP